MADANIRPVTELDIESICRIDEQITGVIPGYDAEVRRLDGARADLVRPCAYVVPTDGASDALAAELLAFASEALSAYKRPKWIEFLPELPKTSTGKVQRFKLRAS